MNHISTISINNTNNTNRQRTANTDDDDDDDDVDGDDDDSNNPLFNLYLLVDDQSRLKLWKIFLICNNAYINHNEWNDVYESRDFLLHDQMYCEID